MESKENNISINVCLSPKLFTEYVNDNSVIAVIDVLRATSVICTALHNGAKCVIPVSDIDEAKKCKSMGYIVGAERHGEIVEGFEIGNSPFSYMNDIKGKTVVLTTTNGTKAITAANNSHKVVIASFLNLNAISNWLAKQNRDIVLLCAGWKNKFNMEDTLLAGAIVEQLLSQKTSSIELSDSAIAAKLLYLQAKDDLFGFLANSSHRRRLEKLNLDKDVKYCLTPNQTDVIPVFDGESIRVLKE